MATFNENEINEISYAIQRLKILKESIRSHCIDLDRFKRSYKNHKLFEIRLGNYQRYEGYVSVGFLDPLMKVIVESMNYEIKEHTETLKKYNIVIND